MTHTPSLVALGIAALVSAPAQAQLTYFQGGFAAEAVGASGSGALHMIYDAAAHTLELSATFAGLSGTTTAAHIHCCTASSNTGTAGVALAQSGILPGFPTGVQGAYYSRVIDLTSTTQYGATFLSASGGTAALAEARLISNLTSGNAYFNIHSTNFTGGEIRAFVTVVPEPETYALMLAGLGLVGWTVRRSRRA